MLSATLNFCLIYDLITMMMRPFADKSHSMQKYIIICVSVSSLTALASSAFYIKTSKKHPVIGSLFLVFYVSLYVIGVYSVHLAYKVLSKPGISSQLRTLVLKRHTAGIIVF
jgi:hypothetical protein